MTVSTAQVAPANFWQQPLRWLQQQALKQIGQKLISRFLALSATLASMALGLQGAAGLAESMNLLTPGAVLHPGIFITCLTFGVINFIVYWLIYVRLAPKLAQRVQDGVEEPTKRNHSRQRYLAIISVFVCGFLNMAAVIVMVHASFNSLIPIEITLALGAAVALTTSLSDLEETFSHFETDVDDKSYMPARTAKWIGQLLSLIVSGMNALAQAFIFTIGLYPVMPHVLSLMVSFGVLLTVAELLNHLFYRPGQRVPHTLLVLGALFTSLVIFVAFPTLHSTLFGLKISAQTAFCTSLGCAFSAGLATEYLFYYKTLAKYFARRWDGKVFTHLADENDYCKEYEHQPKHTGSARLVILVNAVVNSAIVFASIASSEFGFVSMLTHVGISAPPFWLTVAAALTLSSFAGCATYALGMSNWAEFGANIVRLIETGNLDCIDDTAQPRALGAVNTHATKPASTTSHSDANAAKQSPLLATDARHGEGHSPRAAH